jgi:tryptophan synthase beta chain
LGILAAKFVPEILIPVIEELEQAYLEAKDDPLFQKEYADF